MAGDSAKKRAYTRNPGWQPFASQLFCLGRTYSPEAEYMGEGKVRSSYIRPTPTHEGRASFFLSLPLIQTQKLPAIALGQFFYPHWLVSSGSCTIEIARAGVGLVRVNRGAVDLKVLRNPVLGVPGSAYSSPAPSLNLYNSREAVS